LKEQLDVLHQRLLNMDHLCSGVQMGWGELSDGPGNPREGGIQRVKLQRFTCRD